MKQCSYKPQVPGPSAPPTGNKTWGHTNTGEPVWSPCLLVSRAMSSGSRARMMGTAAEVGGKIMHSATVQLLTWRRQAGRGGRSFGVSRCSQFPGPIGGTLFQCCPHRTWMRMGHCRITSIGARGQTIRSSRYQDVLRKQELVDNSTEDGLHTHTHMTLSELSGLK